MFVSHMIYCIGHQYFERGNIMIFNRFCLYVLLGALFPVLALAAVEPPLNDTSPGSEVSEAPPKQQFGKNARLESKFPNSLGYARELNSMAFLDANISIQYPLFFSSFKGGCNKFFHTQPFLSYTGRFGQYIGDENSSPVVTKTFNPELSLRIYSNISIPNESLDKICAEENNLSYHELYQEAHNKPSKSLINYYDIQFGHLSNGQAIDNQQSLNTFSQTRAIGGNTEFAKKYISRGWDYYGVYGKYFNPFSDISRGTETIELGLQHFIGGPLTLQKTIEEYPWENPASNITQLEQVRGLSLKYSMIYLKNIIDSVSVSFDTGLNNPFRYNTYKVEIGIMRQILCVPLSVWYQNGYASDLAQYYNLVESFGIKATFTTFDDVSCRK